MFKIANVLKAVVVIVILGTTLLADKIPGISYKRYTSLPNIVLKKINKPVLIMVIDEKCPYCREELYEMSQDHELIKMLKNDIVLVFAIKNKDNINPRLLSSLMVPSFYPIDPRKGKFFVAAQPASGKISTQDLKRWIQQIAKAYHSSAKVNDK